MQPRGLRSNPDFRKLWAGQAISLFGSFIGNTALQFTAIIFLDASALQVALLTAAGLAPQFLGGLVAGAWADRIRRRPILIAADTGRALVLVTIPLAAALGVLRIEQLYAVAFLAGVLTIFFDVAYQSYVPSLVRQEELVQANSRLAASESAAEIGGFALAGWLVQALTGPGAMLVDALSFAASALFIGRIRAAEPPPVPASERDRLRAEIGEGLRAVLRDPILRALAGTAVVQDFAFRVIGAVILLYATRELGFSPGVQGLIFGIGGVTSLAGALGAGRIAALLGLGRAAILGVLVTGAGTLVLPLAHGATVAAALLLIVNQLITDPASAVFRISEVSLRQAVAPERMLGRVNGSIQFAGFGAQLAGTFAGGVLAEVIGLRATLVVGTAGILLAGIWLATSPVRHVRATTGPVMPAPAA